MVGWFESHSRTLQAGKLNPYPNQTVGLLQMLAETALGLDSDATSCDSSKMNLGSCLTLTQTAGSFMSVLSFQTGSDSQDSQAEAFHISCHLSTL